jgi:hypothetical protein
VLLLYFADVLLVAKPQLSLLVTCAVAVFFLRAGENLLDDFYLLGGHQRGEL